MIILTIGEASRRLAALDVVEESWVVFHMRTSAVDPAPPGVHVRIAAPSLGLNLSAGEDASAHRFGRALSRLESRVLELWQQRGLDRPDFRSGQLVAFLHQLCDLMVTKRGLCGIFSARAPVAQVDRAQVS